MKKYFVFMFILFAAKAYCAQMDPININMANMTIDDSSYNFFHSSNVSTLSDVVISSYPVRLKSLIVNTTGSINSKISIWDTKISTSSSGITMISNIVTNLPKDFLYTLTTSSGLAVNNFGTTPADITVIYKQK
jgi:hypothetical protein